jgi:poly-gamma-glutamate synthesis protein (capsule biosynthesis protein)
MKLIVCGDFKAYTSKFTKHFEHSNSCQVFGDIVGHIQTADISIYHQESPLTHCATAYFTKNSGVVMKCSPSSASSISYAGLSLATFASNHTLDYGLRGIRDTIANLNRVGIDVIGAGSTIEDARKPYIYEKDGVSICILNYAETQLNVATESHGGANPLDIVENYREILKYRAEVDHVIVIIHGGTDFCPYPSPRMVKQYRFYIEAGATAVINHHQHVVSGYEIYQGKPIFYGIANIIPGKIVVPGCLYGIAVALELDKLSLKWDMIPLKFNESAMRLEELQGATRQEFFDYVESLSEVISNPEHLKTKYGQFLDEKWRKTGYNISFSKHSRTLFRIARKVGMVDAYTKIMGYEKFSNNFRNNTLWNLVRCETHRDALGHYYETDIDTYKNE